MGTLKNLTIMVLLTSAVSAVKADDIALGIPGYGGTGCPAGTASVSLSPDRKTLSVLFDQFVASAGSSAGKFFDRKSCNIAIPVHVPQGFSVAIFRSDYRGYNHVPYGGRSQFSAEYFFAGMRGPRIVQNFRGPVDDEYLISSDLLASALVWSPCGADVNLRVNASMIAQSNSYGEEVLSTVDSADFESGLIYHIQWRQCR